MPSAPVTPPSRGLATLGYAGDPSTGAELREVLSTLSGQTETPYAGLEQLLSTSWEQATKWVSQLVIVPTVTSWARSRHRKIEGPQPQRNSNWPWGLPWLSPRDKDLVDSANENLRQHFALMNFCVQHCPSTHLLFIHPEDLGRADQGQPASIWQLTELKAWANRWGLKRYGTHQCRFGKSEWPFPIGVLSSHPLPHALFTLGWPKFDSDRHYIGPLPRYCECPPGTHRRDAEFDHRRLRSMQSTLIHPGLQHFLALLFLDGASNHRSAAKLLRKGVPGILVRADMSSIDDDLTDAEEAQVGSIDRGPFEHAGLVSSGRADSQTALDTRALQALGLQDLVPEVFDQQFSQGFIGNGIHGETKGKSLSANVAANRIQSNVEEKQKMFSVST